MEKIKHKFITLVFLGIMGIIFLGIYSSYRTLYMDKQSFVMLLNGNGKMNDHLLKLNERKLIKSGDIVKTIGESSLLIIEWGDGSLTRMGGNSTVLIKNNVVAHNLSRINIAFELINGKSWSNVISFIGKDSYFKETFRDNEAAVRGTIFNVDLTNDYISVIKHKIDLVKKDGEVIEINENQPFSLKNFSFLQINEFLQKIKDQAFDDMNQQFDHEFLSYLHTQVKQKISDFQDIGSGDFSQFSQDKKDELYSVLLQKYQALNFLQPGDDLFSKKLEYKNQLILLASEDNKKSLLQSTLVDLKDSIENNNVEAFSKILPVLKQHAGILEKFHLDVNQYFNMNTLSQDFKNALNRNIEILKNIFPNFATLDIQASFSDIQNKAKSTIENGLNSLFGK